MPTRFPVLLQSRKSALAGSAHNMQAPMTSMAQARACAPARRRTRRIAVLVRCRLLPSALRAARTVRAPISREPSSPVNEDGPEVVHVGQGGSRGEQIAQFLEEFRRIIVLKKGGRIEAEAARARERGGVDEGARGVLGVAAAAVGAVGVA